MHAKDISSISSRFTLRVRRVLDYAREDAAERGAPAVGTLNLLSGLARERHGLLTLLFAKWNLSLSTLCGISVPSQAQPGQAKGHDLALDVELEQVLRFAAEEADGLSRAHIGTEHLLLGILRAEDSEAGKLLTQHGMRLDEARRHIVALASESPANDAGVAFELFVTAEHMRPVAARYRPHEVVIRSAVPTFLVANVAHTARWYAANLGFHTAGTVRPEEPYAYASLQRGAAEIILLALADYEKPDLRGRRPSGLWDAYIRVDGVHALYEPLGRQPFIQMPLTQQPYGDWEFEVRDPNGYVLVFGGSY